MVALQIRVPLETVVAVLNIILVLILVLKIPQKPRPKMRMKAPAYFNSPVNNRVKLRPEFTRRRHYAGVLARISSSCIQPVKARYAARLFCHRFLTLPTHSRSSHAACSRRLTTKRTPT
jgi:hypothetical protein